MGKMVSFALNQMTCRNLSFDRFLEVSRALGCVGVELRTDIDFFDVNPPAEVARKVTDAGLRVLALAELYAFNDLTSARYDAACRLMELAVDCGAEGLVLIPSNEGPEPERQRRLDGLHRSFEILAPELAAHTLTGFVEPLGFATSSLQSKADVVETVIEMGLTSRIKLVHDTFHHALAQENAVYAAHTGILHVSGVSLLNKPISELQDKDRGFVGADDQLGNISQINALCADGYAGPLSFELFAPEVHSLRDPAPALLQSIEFITQQHAAKAA